MNGKLAVGLVFIAASIVTIYLILRRPYLYLRIGKRHIKLETYFIGALLGPVLIIAFGLLNYSQIIKGLNGDRGFSPVGILVLFLSMVFISIFLDITGFFEYCARLALKFSGRDGKRLFFALYITVSILTIFTSNDIIILTFTPFIYYFTKNAGINPTPYLIGEFFAANTWSMMLYIGNPTNILLAAAFGVRFDKYLRWMFLPTLAAGMINMLLIYTLFRKDIMRPIRETDQKDPICAITDRAGALVGLSLLGGCILALAIAPYFMIEMWYVALFFAIALLILLIVRDSSVALLRSKLKQQGFHVANTVRKMPWGIIPFVLSLFITVEALRIYGVSGDIGGFLRDMCGHSVAASVFVYGISSALAANLLNNIPMTVAYVPVIGALTGRARLAAILSTTVGSNLGANITPVGALAGIMWMSILGNKDFHISFKEFTWYGILVTPLTLIVCLSVLTALFLLF